MRRTAVRMLALTVILTVLPLPARAAATDLYRRCLCLDGVDNSATAADSASLDVGTGPTDDFTIETFFYVPDLANTTTDTLLFKNGAYGIYVLYKTTTSDRIIFRLNYSSIDYFYVYADVNLSVGWHHVAAVWDNEYSGEWDYMGLYVDGALAAGASNFEITPGVYNSTYALTLGSGPNGVNPAAGRLEEARVSSVVRYAGGSFAVPSVPFTPDADTRALWHFDETPGSTSFADSSAYGNTAAGANGGETCNAPGVTVAPLAVTVTEASSTSTVTMVLDAAPSADVVIDVVSGDTAEATVTPSQLTFTPSNWPTPQPVSVTGVDDPVDDGDRTTVVALTMNGGLTADPLYAVVDPPDVVVTTLDNDTAGIGVSTPAVTVAESGTTATFTAVLTSRPAGDVVINVQSADPGEATAGPTPLTFTNDNWAVPQVVTVTGVDDLDHDGDQITGITLAADPALSDDAYDGVPAAHVSATTTDDDTPAIILSTTSVEVSESGTTAAFTARLACQPSSGNVVIDVTSSDPGEATALPAQLTFSTTDWATPKSVTVTGVDDTIVDGARTSSITLAVNAAMTADPGYDAAPAVHVTATTTDAGDTAGVTVTPTAVSVAESGTTQAFTVVLRSEPAGSVVVDIAPSDPGEATATPSQLTFTSSNWSIARPVTVTGVDDLAVDHDQTSTVVLTMNTAATTDPVYDAVDPADVTVTTTDDDSAGRNVSATTVTAREGGTPATFTLVLTAQPAFGSVVFDVTSADPAQVAVSPAQLTFGTGDWSTPHTVTVTAIDDAIDDGDVVSTVNVVVNAALTDDPAYDLVAAAHVTVNAVDNEGINVIATSPAANAPSVIRSSNVQATANATIAPASVTATSFRVYGEQSGRLAGIYGSSGPAFSFDPANNFKPGETIEAVATAAVADPVGERLVPFAWRFTAAAAPAAAVMIAHPVRPTLGSGPNQAVALGDLDGDGDLDAAVGVFPGEGAGNVSLWRNDGTGDLGSAPYATVGSDSASEVSLGDLDSDGDLDLVVGVWQAAKKVWLNDGSGNFPGPPNTSIGHTAYASRIPLGDLDGDGDLDAVVSGNTGSPQTVWLNDGMGVFSTHPTVPSFGSSDPAKVILGDLNSDGTLDAVVAREGPETVWLNDGTGAFSPAPTDHFGGEFSSGAALGDIDKDGDLDVVVANRWPTPHTVWLNDGTGQFSPHPVTPTFGSDDAFEIVLADMDGDGDLDAITTGNERKLFLNDGTGSFSSRPAFPLYSDGFGFDIAPGDLDGDGDLDIVVPLNPTQVLLNRNPGGVIVTPVSGLRTNEGGGTATFSVALASAPLSDVSIQLTSSDPTEARLSWSGETPQDAITILFRPSDWMTPRTVTVHGQDDHAVDGDVAFAVTTAPAVSPDPLYSALDAADVTGTNGDDDTAGIEVSPSSVSVAENGTTADFRVMLTSQPAGNVVIQMMCSDASEATLSPAQLTFTPASWSSAQVVTVTGVDDALDDGEQQSNVAFFVNAPADPLYNAYTVAPVLITTTDDDRAPTSTALVSSLNPSAMGQVVTFTVTVTSPVPGTITGGLGLFDGADSLGGITLTAGYGTLNVHSLSPGSHSITARYTGDPNYAGSTSAPVIQVVNLTWPSPPIDLVATAAGTSQVRLTWMAVVGASGYEVYRTAAAGTPFALVGTSTASAYTDSTVSANTTYLYKVRAIAGGEASPFSNVDAATTVVFTDPALNNTTLIKRLHVTELRTAVNAVRTAAGLSPATYTDPTISSGMTVEASHVTELRAALVDARAALGLPTITWTDPAISAGTAVRAVHWTQLRDGTK